jgi:hypothetical protein
VNQSQSSDLDKALMFEIMVTYFVRLSEPRIWLPNCRALLAIKS